MIVEPKITIGRLDNIPKAGCFLFQRPTGTHFGIKVDMNNVIYVAVVSQPIVKDNRQSSLWPSQRLLNTMLFWLDDQRIDVSFPFVISDRILPLGIFIEKGRMYISASDESHIYHFDLETGDVFKPDFDTADRIVFKNWSILAGDRDRPMKLCDVSA